MRITVLFILTLSWHKSGIQTQRCGRPEVTRSQVYIYHRIEEISVKVYRCLFNDNSNAYSDITNNCINAFNTGILRDKWQSEHYLEDRGSPVVLEEYYTTADLVKNEIRLRSGAVCRYDRGFCYDPTETNDYAVVWNVAQKPLERCTSNLRTVFYGRVDLWHFPKEHLKFLFYYDESRDEAFYLRLVKTAKCNNKAIWITERNEFIVSESDFTTYSNTAMFMFKYYFPMESKKAVSEAVMRSCDLQEFPLDFSERITDDHLEDSRSLKIILESYQQLILEVKEDVEKKSGKKVIGGNISGLDTLLKNLTNLELLVSHKITEMSGINRSMEELQRIIGSVNSNETIRKIHQELLLADQRILAKIDGEHKALENLEKKLADLDTLLGKENSVRLTRVEFNEELMSLQMEMNRRIRELASKFESILRDNHSNLKNNNSKFQKDVVKRCEKSLENLEDSYENLTELVKNVRKQLADDFTVMNKSVLENFTLLKNDLTKIEQELSDFQPLLTAAAIEQNNNTDNLRKEINDQKNRFYNIVKLGTITIEDMQKNITNTYVNSVHNKFNISDIKNRLDSLLKKIGDVDWNVLRNVKPNRMSQEDFLNEISKIQKREDENLEKLSQNFSSLLIESRTNCSKYYAKIQDEILKDIDSLTVGMKSDMFEHTNKTKQDITRQIGFELAALKQSLFSNFISVENRLREVKSNMSDFRTLILVQLNISENDILNLKTEVKNCNRLANKTMELWGQELEQLKGNVTQTKSVAENNEKNVLTLQNQLSEIIKTIANVKQTVAEDTQKYIQDSRESLADLSNRTDSKLTLIEKSVFSNFSSLKNDFSELLTELVNEYEPILMRLEETNITVEEVKKEMDDFKIDFVSSTKDIESEINIIRVNITEANKVSSSNKEKIHELNDNLGEIGKILENIQKNHSTDLRSLNASLDSQNRSISKIHQGLGSLLDETARIQSEKVDMEKDIHTLQEDMEQIQKDALKNSDLSEKIKLHKIEIDDLNSRVTTLEFNFQNISIGNENAMKDISRNLSEMFETLKVVDQETSDLKSQMKDSATKLDENRKCMERSKDECMGYVNGRLKSVIEEIGQIHSLLLKKGEDIRRIEEQLLGKFNAYRDETKNKLKDKDVLINQLEANLRKLLDLNIDARIKQLEDNVYAAPPEVR